MRHVTSPEEFLELCKAEEKARGPEGNLHPYLVGTVAPPDDLLLHVAPCTLAEHQQDHELAVRDYGEHYKPAIGNCYTLARILLYNPAQLHHDPQQGDPEWPENGRDDLLRWFDAPTGPTGLVDDNSEAGWTHEDGTELAVLTITVWQALGMVVDAPKAASEQATAQEWRERGRNRGRWQPGLFHCDPEAALWVRTASEADQMAANKAATIEWGNGVEVVNDARRVRRLLSDVVRQGPGLGPLFTVTDAGLLQVGAARGLAVVSHQMGMRCSGAAGGRFRPRGERPRMVGPADA